MLDTRGELRKLLGRNKNVVPEMAGLRQRKVS